MAVDLIRSCYEAEVRFYRDIEDTVRIRWYFVPSGTPFVPHRNNFVSSNWDPDPKPQYDLGELPEYGKPWVNGTTVGNAAAIQPCGSAEQWSRGQPLPPATPVPVNAEGTPLCCFIAPPPIAPPTVWLWVRPESIPFAVGGTPVEWWLDTSGNNSHLRQTIPALRPLFIAAPGNGLPGLFFRGLGGSPESYHSMLKPAPTSCSTAKFTVFLAALVLPAPFTCGLALGVGPGAPQARQPIVGTSGVSVIANGNIASVGDTLTLGFHVWAMRRSDGLCEFWRDTQSLGSARLAHDETLPDGLFNLFPSLQSLGRAVLISEVKVWEGVVGNDLLAAELSYFAARY